MIYLERVRNNLLNPDSKLTVVDGGGVMLLIQVLLRNI